jgi:hypothetical protein
MRRFRISIKSVGDVYAKMVQENPKTADTIWSALPLEGVVNIWGDEIYFSIPIIQGLENAKEVVGLGDVCYWPPGNAFCIFFGKTPASRGDEIRAASPVNVFAKIEGDPKVFGDVKEGESVRLERTA